jgi:prepilin-type N-terminal cleavage/methylation domain-containing protein
MIFENNVDKIMASSLQSHLRSIFTNFVSSNSIIKKNRGGFSLIELMVVIGLLGGISLIVMNITKQTDRSSAKFQFDTDVTLTTNEINASISDPVKCLTTFGSTATPSNIVGKYYISTVPPGDQGYGNSKLYITSYTLTGTAPDGVLTILYQNKNILKGSSGAANISKKINMYIEGSPGAITKCRALSTSTTDIWTRGTATDSNNVFYNGGVRAGDETQTNTCDSTVEGTQRYNKVLHTMEYCGYNAGPPATYSWDILGGSKLGTNMVIYGGTTASPCCSACTGRIGVTYTNNSANTRIVYVTMVNSPGVNSYAYINDYLVAGQYGWGGGHLGPYILFVPAGATYRIANGTRCDIWTEWQ